ncbi:MAG: hypothetical protein EP318_05780 [Rhodobacteraceae bacterium]|nr:MAG: hypothetical protein EP318_05780 [Paracoccaceae bacterium]
MIRGVLIAALLAWATGATGASAQTVAVCDWRAAARAIVEPWEANTRTFSNGKTRLALLDTVEPAAGAFHLLILSPPYNELGERQCRMISHDGTMGFAEMAFGALSAGYDPARGLLFDIPVRHVDAATGGITGGWLGLEVNQATGAIATRMGPAD